MFGCFDLLGFPVCCGFDLGVCVDGIFWEVLGWLLCVACVVCV